jgi:hypothetical protein
VNKDRTARKQTLNKRFMVGILLVLLLVLPVKVRWRSGSPEAQEVSVCVPSKTQINTVNAGIDIVVGASLVDVLPVNVFACNRTLWNKGGAPIRCMSKPQGQPSATRGLLLGAGEQILLGTEGREAWWCIRSTGIDSLVVTIEGLP